MGLTYQVEFYGFGHVLRKILFFTSGLWKISNIGVNGAAHQAQLVKNPPAMRETWVRSLGWEDSLEKGKATHSSIVAWKMLWTVQSMGSQRVGHHWAIFTFKAISAQCVCVSVFLTCFKSLGACEQRSVLPLPPCPCPPVLCYPHPTSPPPLHPHWHFHSRGVHKHL